MRHHLVYCVFLHDSHRLLLRHSDLLQLLTHRGYLVDQLMLLVAHEAILSRVHLRWHWEGWVRGSKPHIRLLLLRLLLHLYFFSHLDVLRLHLLLLLKILCKVLVLGSVLLLSPVFDLIIPAFDELVSKITHDLLCAFVNDLSSNLFQRVALDLQR